MAKKIVVIGTGYVGLVTSVGLADFGNNVVGVDIDEEKIKTLRSGKSVIYEPGIEEYLARNLASGRLSFTSDGAEAIKSADVVFIAVGTPSLSDGSADLKYINACVDTIMENTDRYKVVVVKSTVPVGTNRKIQERVKASRGDLIDVVSNPEFLREGVAIYDFFHPDRIVVGHETPRVVEAMNDVYRSLNRISVPFVWCGWESAELIKYASNAFLSTKIAFINQMANLAEAAGADIQMISKGMGMDGRIGSKFLHAGPGYGGSCFPKDTHALVRTGMAYGVDMSIVKEVIRSNEEQRERVVLRAKDRLGSLSGKSVCLWGLTFKAETDDVRDAPAITIAEKLRESGASIRCHDPEGMDHFKRLFPDFSYFNDKYEACESCHALIVLTEWNEYRSADLAELKKRMASAYVFDTRNVIDRIELEKLGFACDFIGARGK
jgi:UDPglucose 6-dehydrogenase